MKPLLIVLLTVSMACVVIAKTNEPTATQAQTAGIEYAKQQCAEYDKANAAAERTRKSMDELADAQLALKLANIDLEVAQGGITKEQGQLARIDTRQSFQQEKIAREKAVIQDRIARGEKIIADAKKSSDDAAAAVAKTEAEIKQLLASIAARHATPNRIAALESGAPVPLK